MAVKLEFFNVIIPIKKIEECKELGGFSGLLKKLKASGNTVFWYDDYLFRDGAMNMDDIDELVNFWKLQGLIPKVTKDGKEYWNDLCIVDSIEGPTLLCSWLEFMPGNERNDPYVFLKGEKTGKIIGQ